MRNTPFACLSLVWFWAAASAGAAEYLALVSKAASDEPEWKAVGDKLATIHSGTCEIWDDSEKDLVRLLQQHQPRYLAIVAKPEQIHATTIRSINRATRSADDDPWTDCRWGLISGNTAVDAMHVAETREPLVIKRALTTTGINLGLVESGLTLSDGTKGTYTRKDRGGKPEEGTWDNAKAPAGTVSMFADYWNNNDPQLLVSSSHATQFNLEMPWGLGLIASHGGKFHVLTQQQRNEFARFLGGAMFTGDPKKLGEWIDTTKAPTLAACKSPRVWHAAGNCLVGDAKGTGESMAVTALSSGFRQMVGYVVPTWYGNNGWGSLKLWQESRGGLNLSESFYLNLQSLIDETITRFPGAIEVDFNSEDIQEGLKSDREFIKGLNALLPKLKIEQKDQKDLLGLIHDRDVVAFWGDPLWDARFDPKALPHPVTSSWKKKEGVLTLNLKANADFEGAYPLWLPARIKNPKLVIPEKAKVDALAADDFLLIRKLTIKKGETIALTVTLTPSK